MPPSGLGPWECLFVLGELVTGQPIALETGIQDAGMGTEKVEEI